MLEFRDKYTEDRTVSVFIPGKLKCSELIIRLTGATISSYAEQNNKHQ